MGMLKKNRQWRSRPFAVLAYKVYAPRAKMAAAFPSAKLRTGLDKLF